MEYNVIYNLKIREKLIYKSVKMRLFIYIINFDN